jgi:hypothetical protein
MAEKPIAPAIAPAPTIFFRIMAIPFCGGKLMAGKLARLYVLEVR